MRHSTGNTFRFTNIYDAEGPFRERQAGFYHSESIVEVLEFCQEHIRLDPFLDEVQILADANHGAITVSRYNRG
jgi:hypothetical protein